MSAQIDALSDRLSPRAARVSLYVMVGVVVLFAVGLFVHPFHRLLAAVAVLFSLVICVGLVTVAAGVVDLSPRFEVGTSERTHHYNGTTIVSTMSVHYDDDGPLSSKKCRSVDCVATDEDGVTVAHRRSIDVLGDRGSVFGLFGGDFEGTRSSNDHLMSVLSETHAAVDDMVDDESGFPAEASTDPAARE